MKTAASDSRDNALKSAGKAYKSALFQRKKCLEMIDKSHKNGIMFSSKHEKNGKTEHEELLMLR